MQSKIFRNTSFRICTIIPVYYTYIRTVISRIRNHDIRIGGYAVRGPLAIRLMNNFHPFVQLRPAASLRERKTRVIVDFLDA